MKCEECNGVGEICVGVDPGCDSPGYYQPPEYVTESCDACGGSGEWTVEEPAPRGEEYE